MECRPRPNTKLGPELRRPYGGARCVGLHLLHQGLPLRARRAHVAEAVHRRVIGRRVRQSAFGRAARLESVVHVGVRAESGRRELQRRVEGTNVGRDGVKGARVHDEHARLPRRVRVPQQAAVDELGLAAQVDIVGLSVDARLNDGLAQEAVLG